MIRVTERNSIWRGTYITYTYICKKTVSWRHLIFNNESRAYLSRILHRNLEWANKGGTTSLIKIMRAKCENPLNHIRKESKVTFDNFFQVLRVRKKETKNCIKFLKSDTLVFFCNGFNGARTRYKYDLQVFPYVYHITRVPRRAKMVFIVVGDDDDTHVVLKFMHTVINLELLNDCVI